MSAIFKRSLIAGNLSIGIEKTLATGVLYFPDPGVPITISNGGTDVEVVAACDFSQLVAILLYSTVNMLLETNDGSSPDDSINLVAGVPYEWFTGWYDTCLITADFTKLFLTNSSGASGTFTYLIGHGDATP